MLLKSKMSKKVIPFNTMPDGTCRTLKSQYFKNSVANFLHDGTWGATAVIVYEDEQDEELHQLCIKRQGQD